MDSTDLGNFLLCLIKWHNIFNLFIYFSFMFIFNLLFANVSCLMEFAERIEIWNK